MICFYLRLALVPFGQNIDHAWQYPDSVSDWLAPAIFLSFVFLVGILLLARKRALGFCIMAFFLILGPTSSFLPITDLAVEHRMYLPLACVLCGITIVCIRVTGQAKFNSAWRIVFLLAITVSLSFISAQRASVFRSSLALWQDSVNKQPCNPRARSNLARAMAMDGNIAGAIEQLSTALDLIDDDSLNLHFVTAADRELYLFRLGTLHLQLGNSGVRARSI